MITAVMPTYGRKDVVFERGEGNYLYATDGRRYVDFTSGIAVNALGHCHPYLVKALTEQGQKLWHTSNLFRIGNGEKLAQRLVENSFADTMFFCNSGAEAIEGGIKLIRKYQYMNGQPKRYKIIAFQAAFHGACVCARRHRQRNTSSFGPPAPATSSPSTHHLCRHGRGRDEGTLGGRARRKRSASPRRIPQGSAPICDDSPPVRTNDEIHPASAARQDVGLRWSA